MQQQYTYCKPAKMSSKILVALGVFAMVVGSAPASLIAARSVEVLQGPSSRTTIVGPDGSSISSSAPGGTVVTDGQVVTPVVGSAILTAAGPEIVVGGGLTGSIVTSHTLAGPAVVPAAVGPVALPPSAIAGPALSIAVHGGEGEYIPDNTEQLYDDGSYRGE